MPAFSRCACRAIMLILDMQISLICFSICVFVKVSFGFARGGDNSTMRFEAILAFPVFKFSGC